MRRVTLSVIVVCGLILMGIIALAQQPDRSNEPNACFEGGSMAGQCETDLAWICGWYVYRYEQGIFGAESVLASCLPLIGIPAGPVTTMPTLTLTAMPVQPTTTPTHTATAIPVQPTATPTHTSTAVPVQPTSTPTHTSTPEPTATPTYTSTPL